MGSSPYTTVPSLDDWEKEWGEEFTTQRATKIAAGGFPVTVGCHRAIELTLPLWGRLSGTETSVQTTSRHRRSEHRFPAGFRTSSRQPASTNPLMPLFIKSRRTVQSLKEIPDLSRRDQTPPPLRSLRLSLHSGSKVSYASDGARLVSGVILSRSSGPLQMCPQPDALFRRVEIARPLRKTHGSTIVLMEWKVWTWPRFANATLSSAFERL
jgi:hypothetical protein